MVNLVTKIRFIFILISTVLILSQTSPAQISITQQEFMHIFTPNSFHKYAYGNSQTYNIGLTGGPNIYDFTSIDLSSPFTSNNYYIDSIPMLKIRYESGAIVIGETKETIEKNPIFLARNDSIFVLGLATTFAPYNFRHNIPYECLGKYPITYNTSFSQTIVDKDTTYDVNWQIISSNTSSSLENTIIDGWGTLKLSIGDFECLRMKKDHTGYGDKEFIFMTKNGIVVMVGDVPASDPDEGVVNGGAQVMIAATLLDVNEKENNIPHSFNLSQNYPNPFNPSTKISWQSPISGYQTLKVYDVLGNETATLVDGYKPAGEYSVVFNSVINNRQLASGIYFYQLKISNAANTTNFVQTKKMIIMK